MGPTAARAALLAGVLVVLLTAASSAGLGPVDVASVAGAGLLVSSGAGAVGFASAGAERRTAFAGALLGLVPVLVVAASLAVSDG